MSRLSRLNPNFKPAFDGVAIAQTLIQKIVEAKPLSEVYIFGSCAEGKNTENSDLDLLVVIPDDLEVKDYYKFVNAPFFSPVAVDWIIITQTDFLKNREIGGYTRVAYLTGKRIWPNGNLENTEFVQT